MQITIDGEKWTVQLQFRKCNKPRCTPCREGKGHGPYYYGYRQDDGKQKSRYFGKTLPKQLI